MRIIKLQSEEEDLNPIQPGNEQSFDQLFRQYYAPLTYFAHSIIGNREAAEDMVEDVFVKLWQRPEILSKTGNIKSYLYTAVHHACINVLRKEKVIKAYQKEVTANGEAQDRPVLHRIIEAETMHFIYLVIEKLPPKSGRVLKMFYLQGKKLEEIATELGLSLSTVKSQKARALQLLKKRLAHISISLLIAFLLNF